MLELVILFLIGRNVKRTAVENGLNGSKYVAYTVLLWFGFEALFYLLGLLLFRVSFLAYLFALIGAALGGYLGLRIVSNASNSYTNYEEVE